jgi:hypothetical protein
VALRRVSPNLLGPIRGLLDGESDALLADLFDHLLESRPARREAAQIQEALRVIEDFYHHDALRLHEARQVTGAEASFVPHAERDALFIQARSARAS